MLIFLAACAARADLEPSEHFQDVQAEIDDPGVDGTSDSGRDDDTQDDTHDTGPSGTGDDGFPDGSGAGRNGDLYRYTVEADEGLGWLEVAVTNVRDGSASVEAYADDTYACWQSADLDEVDETVWIAVDAGHSYAFEVTGHGQYFSYDLAITHHAVRDAAEPDSEREEARAVSGSAQGWFAAGLGSDGFDYDAYDDWFTWESDGTPFEVQITSVPEDVMAGVEMYAPGSMDYWTWEYGWDQGDDVDLRVDARKPGTWYGRVQAGSLTHSGCVEGAAPDSMTTAYTLTVGAQ